MDQLTRMRVFQRVVEMSSFSRAAESLSLPRASVSEAVATLEAGLGTQLLYRTTRQLRLSPDGQVFLERCRAFLAEAEALSEMFRGDDRVEGRLRVDMSVSLARRLIIPKLDEFLDANPGIELELSCTDGYVDIIGQGFDCVVRGGQRLDSSLVVVPLGEMRLINVSSPAYLSRHGTPQTPEDLKNHWIVGYGPQMGASESVFEYMAGPDLISLPMKSRIRVNSTEAFTATALAGLGIIQTPATAVGAALASGALTEILKPYAAAPIPLAMILPNRKHRARRVQRFVDWMRTVLKADMGLSPSANLTLGAICATGSRQRACHALSGL